MGPDGDWFPVTDPYIDSDDDDEGIAMGIPCEAEEDKKPKRNSYLASIKTNGIKLDETNEDITNFKLISTTCYFESHDMLDMCLVCISVPSGLYVNTLVGIVTPSVSQDGMSLLVRCEWPAIMCDCSLLTMGFGDELESLTLSNMVHAHNKENLSLKQKVGMKSEQELGGLSVVKLKFEVERKPLRIQPLMCTETDGVMLAVILRKHVVQLAGDEPLAKMRKIDKPRYSRCTDYQPKMKF